MTSVFGPLVSPWDVEQAVLSTLRAWLPTYLYELERVHSLKQGTIPQPPAPESLFGSSDFTYWQQDLLPSVAVVANPTGAPELAASVGYAQAYEIEVAAVVTWDDATGDTARMLAGHYGTAIAAAVVQNGALGTFAAARTVMVAAPKVSLPEPDIRTVCLATTGFHIYVEPIVVEDAGPDAPTPTASALYGGTAGAPFGQWPTVTSHPITVDAEEIDEPAPDTD